MNAEGHIRCALVEVELLMSLTFAAIGQSSTRFTPTPRTSPRDGG